MPSKKRLPRLLVLMAGVEQTERVTHITPGRVGPVDTPQTEISGYGVSQPLQPALQVPLARYRPKRVGHHPQPVQRHTPAVLAEQEIAVGVGEGKPVHGLTSTTWPSSRSTHKATISPPRTRLPAAGRATKRPRAGVNTTRRANTTRAGPCTRP